MEEKKTIKISMSTFFLIIAIIAICVMGFFIYKLNDEKNTATEQLTTLNSKSANTENKKSITEDNTNKTSNTQNSIEAANIKETTENKDIETYTYENISGYFTFNEKIPVDYGTYTSDTEAHNFLYLYENGTFFYEHGFVNARATGCGNYIIKDNKIILNHWFSTTSYGEGLYLSDFSYTLDINSIDSISPELGYTNYPKVVMKRETNSELVKAAANKYEEKLKHDTLYNYSNTDMYTQPGQGQ